MPKQTFADNPVHTILNDYPAALLPASLACDLLYTVTRRPTFRNASFLALTGALATGAAAAATGLADYEEIPEGTEAKRYANAHLLLNAGIMGAVGLNVLMRLTGHVSAAALLLNGLTSGALVASSWFGSNLVYRQGLRVRGVDPTEESDAPTEDAGKAIAQTLETWVTHVPATDLRVKFALGAMTARDVAGQARGVMDQVAAQTRPTLERAAEQASEIVRRSPLGPSSESDTADDEREEFRLEREIDGLTYDPVPAGGVPSSVTDVAAIDADEGRTGS